MMPEDEFELESYTFSLITQGKFRFYSLTLPSKVLASTCFVTTRSEDPLEGFQRTLDETRANQIASYIDSGESTIPSSIVLSAQDAADLKIKPGGRALTFRHHPKAFLVLDGQHRVFGFSKARSDLRVPVVIYNNLTRQQETRLFIDINTKQKPVPNELLLDIKHLADIENNEEAHLRDLFNTFSNAADSVLKGQLSPHERINKKLSRVSFNGACKPILPYLGDRTAEEIYEILNSYLEAFSLGLAKLNYQELLLRPFGFKAIIGFFPEVASRVKGRYGGDYTTDAFADVLADLWANTGRSQLNGVSSSAAGLSKHFRQALAKGFRL